MSFTECSLRSWAFYSHCVFPRVGHTQRIRLTYSYLVGKKFGHKEKRIYWLLKLLNYVQGNDEFDFIQERFYISSIFELFIKCFWACSAFFWHFLIKISFAVSLGLCFSIRNICYFHLYSFSIQVKEIHNLVNLCCKYFKSRNWISPIFFSLCTTGTQECHLE